MTCASKLFRSQSGNVYATPQTMESNPPLEETYKSLFKKSADKKVKEVIKPVVIDEADQLPLIDLGRLELGEAKREECMREIADASREWGFFQIRNHGISNELLQRISREQMKVFRQPFEKKEEERLLKFSADSYRWGSPNATSLQQLSWSEAYHIPLATAAAAEQEEVEHPNMSLRIAIKEIESPFSALAQRLADILAEHLGHESNYFAENCPPSTCYLRLNRYPPCPISREVYGLVPHTDSDFLTILCQDQVGGLQLLKDGRWVTVKSNPDALVVNIGDLFQAWSNGVYRSVEHRVMTHAEAERFSVAYFMCPSYDTVIDGYRQPAMYRQFTFREFRQQVQEDVQTMGCKIGLPKFLNPCYGTTSKSERYPKFTVVG